MLLYVIIFTVLTYWVPQEGDSEREFSMKVFIQCPCDQYLQEGGERNGNGQRERLCYDVGLAAASAGSMEMFWN